MVQKTIQESKFNLLMLKKCWDNIAVQESVTIVALLLMCKRDLYKAGPWLASGNLSFRGLLLFLELVRVARYA